MTPRRPRLSNRLRQAALAALLVMGTSRMAYGQGTIVVSFEIPPDLTVQVGGPFYFDATVQNASTDTVRLKFGHHGKWNYEFALVNPDGTTTAIPPYRQIGPGPKGTIVVEANQTRTRRVIFNEWHNFAAPGEYVLKLRLTVLLSSSANVSWQKEFFEDLRVNVAPYNPASLKETCARLADVAAGPAEGDAAADASLALSYVSDPVAVPFLAKVLREGTAAARPGAVRGLTRVGTREAQEALRSRLPSADPELKARIESALTQFPPGS